MTIGIARRRALRLGKIGYSPPGSCMTLPQTSARCRRDFVRLAPALLALALLGCAAQQDELAIFPPTPQYAADHRFKLDELVELSVHRNAALDVARYEAEAVQGLVDQVKSLWLPTARYDLVATAYDNDITYKANAFNLVTIDVPITGAYNVTNTVALGQIIATFGKRTSGLKQVKMYAAIKKLDILRQQDAVALDVTTYHNLILLTSEIDAVLEDTQRRMQVLHQVARGQNERGSLRVTSLDTLQADFFVSQIEQLRVQIQAGRRQAYSALRQSVGFNRDEQMMLAAETLPPALTPEQIQGAYETIVMGFAKRPELQMVDLFARLRAEQVNFAKRAWAPNIAFVGSFVNVSGNNNTIIGVVDGLVAGLIVDWPIYDPSRRAKLREALGMEYAAAAFQRQIEELITLEIEVTKIDCQKALALAFRAARSMEIAAEHYDAAREAFSHDLQPAATVATALAIDMIAKVQHAAALFGYQQGRAKLRRVTADREAALGY